jgi:hypothetical protein
MFNGLTAQMHNPVASFNHDFDGRFVAQIATNDFLVRCGRTQSIAIRNDNCFRQMGQTLAAHCPQATSRTCDQQSFHHD